MTSNTTARDFIGTLQNLYVFIQTCTKRHAVYTQQQAEIHASSGSTKSFQVRTLKSLCETALGLPSKCDQHIQCDHRGNCRNVENHPRN